MTELQESRHGPHVVLSAVSSDSHTRNLAFFQHLLEELGCRVRNLGARVPDDVLIEAIRAHKPDALVISTVNGHGYTDGTRLIASIRADEDPAVAGVPAIIGGKLGFQGEADADRDLLAAGFDAVFTGEARLPEFSRTLSRLAHAGEAATALGAAA